MTGKRSVSVVRFVLLLLLLALLYFATGSRWVLALCVFALLLPPLSLWANYYVARGLRLRLLLPTTTAKQSACVGTLVLENRSWLPAAGLSCRLSMVNDLTGEETCLPLRLSLAPRGETRQELLLESAHCGRIYVQVLSVSIPDYFGLFFLRVAAKASARITVLPELFSCEVFTSAVSAVAEDASLCRRGDDATEVFQLREYQWGDDVRRIHWKLSSKLDSLLLKEMGQSVSRSVLVFWDKGMQCPPEKMDAMAEVTASVCQGLCDRGLTFDLAWTEGEELELRQIRDGDTLLRTLPALVTRAGRPECPMPETADYGQVIWITCQLPEAGAEGIRYLVCDENAPVGCVAFSAQQYEKQLERLEL